MEAWIAIIGLVISLIITVSGTLRFAYLVGSNNTEIKESVKYLKNRVDEHQVSNDNSHAIIHSRLDDHDRKLNTHSEKITQNTTNITSLMHKGCAGS